MLSRATGAPISAKQMRLRPSLGPELPFHRSIAMAAVTERQILDVLGRVRDPDKGSDIVSLKMVSGIVIRDGNVGFAIEVEPERGPRLEPLRKAAEAAVEALPGVLSVTAVLTAESRASGQRPAPHTHGPNQAPGHAPGHAPAAQR